MSWQVIFSTEKAISSYSAPFRPLYKVYDVWASYKTNTHASGKER
jgi:hypothetical protein